jgi:phospholipid-binding lipoprotein MlaA
MSSRLAPPTGLSRAIQAAALGAMLVGLSGCATPRQPDPLEGWNRQVFAFNEKADAYVFKPLAEGYKAITPEPVRTAFNNFAGNIKDVWSTANLFLQGRFKDGTLGVIRVSVNTTFGLLGTIDMASYMQLDRLNEDFGQTLGVWGVKPGAYIVWPLLGPSTLRDSVGLPGDWYFSVSTLGTYPREVNVLRVTDAVRLRASLLDAGNLIDDVALDKYAFIRDAFLQRRQNLIYEGDPPEEDEPPLMEDPPGTGKAPAADVPAPATAASAASAPTSAPAAAPAASAASAP